MKIVYVLTRSDVIGGASVHLLDLAEGMLGLGHQVTILVGGSGVFFNYASDRGIDCVAVKHMVREVSPMKDVQCFFELASLIRQLRPDLIHAHSSKAGVLARLVAKRLSVPVIFTAHGWSFTDGVSKRSRTTYRCVERLMAAYSDKIITVSEFDRQLALVNKVGGAGSVVAIHNGVRLSAIRRIRKPLCLAPKLAMVARFDEQKDQLLLVSALARLKHLSWRCDLIGDGPLLAIVKQESYKKGISDRVRFTGARKDVPDLLAKADIFVLVSKWEGLPLTILEAMRAGLPVIASDVGGVAESVDHGKTGILVPRGNEDKLVDALSKLILSHELRDNYGRAGLNRFFDLFGFEAMLRKTIAVYDDVVRK